VPAPDGRDIEAPSGKGGARVIDLYTYRTANGRKASIMLEECGLPYTVHVIDITKGEQHADAFRRINPNQRIPAIVDSEGPDGVPVRVFESGAILLYLAEKCGRLLGTDRTTRLEAIQWLMWQMGGVGPMFGQDFHFRHQVPEGTHPEAVAYGRKRYHDEVLRLMKVVDYRVREFEFIAKVYTVADIAVFPWVALHKWLDIDLQQYDGLKRWYARIEARPAVQRGMNIPARATMG
jgi:GST-like protein